MQNVYISKEKALRDFGVEELQANSLEIFNRLSVANQIMYNHHLTQMYASLKAQEDAMQLQSCKQCEDVPPPGEEDYS